MLRCRAELVPTSRSFSSVAVCVYSPWPSLVTNVTTTLPQAVLMRDHVIVDVVEAARDAPARRIHRRHDEGLRIGGFPGAGAEIDGPPANQEGGIGRRGRLGARGRRRGGGRGATGQQGEAEHGSDHDGDGGWSDGPQGS